MVICIKYAEHLIVLFHKLLHRLMERVTFTADCPCALYNLRTSLTGGFFRVVSAVIRYDINIVIFRRIILCFQAFHKPANDSFLVPAGCQHSHFPQAFRRRVFLFLTESKARNTSKVHADQFQYQSCKARSSQKHTHIPHVFSTFLFRLKPWKFFCILFRPALNTLQPFTRSIVPRSSSSFLLL